MAQTIIIMGVETNSVVYTFVFAEDPSFKQK